MAGGIGVHGITVFKMDGNSYYTREAPRGALSATFVVKVLNIVGSPTVTVTLQARKEDEPSTWSIVGSFSAITATGTYTLEASGIDELYRLSVDFDSLDAASDGVTLEVEEPMWIPA